MSGVRAAQVQYDSNTESEVESEQVLTEGLVLRATQDNIYVEIESENDLASSDYNDNNYSSDDEEAIELTHCAPIQNEEITIQRVTRLRQQRLSRPPQEQPPNPYLTPAQANTRNAKNHKATTSVILKQQRLSVYAPPALDPDLPYGDSSLVNPNSLDFRIYLINPNGLPAADEFTAVHNLCHMADGVEID
jgi:hypothetical protein